MQVRHRPALTLRRKGEAKKQKEMGHRRVTFIKGAGYVRPQYVLLNATDKCFRMFWCCNPEVSACFILVAALIIFIRDLLA